MTTRKRLLPRPKPTTELCQPYVTNPNRRRPTKTSQCKAKRSKLTNPNTGQRARLAPSQSSGHISRHRGSPELLNRIGGKGVQLLQDSSVSSRTQVSGIDVGSTSIWTTATFTGPRRKPLFPKAARPAAPCATYCYAAIALSVSFLFLSIGALGFG